MRPHLLALISLGACGANEDVETCDPTGPAGTITLVGSPIHRVLFHDRDGAVLSEIQLDAQGLGTGTVPPCGAVTFVKGTSTYFTVTEVMPGDEIALRYPQVAPGLPRAVSVDVPSFPGAIAYSVHPFSHGGFSGCDSRSGVTSPITFDADDRCIAADQTLAFLVTASDANGPIAYAGLERVPVAAAGTTTATVTQWRTDVRATSASFSNGPDPSWPAIARFWLLLGGMHPPPGVPEGGWLPAAGTHLLLDASFIHPGGHERGIDLLMQSVPATQAAELALDGTRDFAPHVSTVTRDDTDPTRPHIAWTTTAPPSARHALAFTADWEELQWFVVAPSYVPGTIQFPDLPPDLRPTSAPQTGDGAQAVMVGELSWADGYDELRREPLALWFPTLFRPATDGFAARTSTLGDYDQPNVD